ncbi:MAG: hypothetical protein NTW95_01850 [Candidatus Aminicenantes bacterium]|nr:hypothetical protein [Candidatus Aminicenantes bacterium]
MRKFLFVAFLVLLLQAPHASKASAYGQNAAQSTLSKTAAPEKADRFSDSDDDIFSTTYERELLSRRMFKKSLPPLSRKEKVSWSFRTARANTFL